MRPAYKPLLFSTTMRNPERMKLFLATLNEFEGKTLTNALIEEFVGIVVEKGIYTPSNLSSSVKQKISQNIPLNEEEKKTTLKENPQIHKEAGFDPGWPSRFDTWFKLAMEMGFVFYAQNETIEFSEIGKLLASNEQNDSESNVSEHNVFLNVFAKYQRNNPFRRILNENVPLILLLQVIIKLNSDPNTSNAGIGIHEVPLLIYWKNNNADALYERIIALRKAHGFTPSSEVILSICQQEIMEGRDKKRNMQSIVGDYQDDFIRKMRVTGLISLRGNGRFLDINNNEKNVIDYVIKNYSSYRKINDRKEYFEYMSTIDEYLVRKNNNQITPGGKENLFSKWVEHYSWETLKKELGNLAKKHYSRDEYLKYISAPIRLEFLTALAIKSKFPNICVKPNYPIDDEGLPISTAPGRGNTGDIECLEDGNGILVEVTMSQGAAQTKMEVWPIARHLEAFSERIGKSMCFFIAPSIYTDSIRQIDFLKSEDNITIIPKSISEFIVYLESNSEASFIAMDN